VKVFPYTSLIRSNKMLVPDSGDKYYQLTLEEIDLALGELANLTENYPNPIQVLYVILMKEHNELATDYS
jgi:hypothetical protein